MNLEKLLLAQIPAILVTQLWRWHVSWPTIIEMTGMGTSAAAEMVEGSTTAPRASVKAASRARSSGGLKNTGKGDPPKADPFILTVNCPYKVTNGQIGCMNMQTELQLDKCPCRSAEATECGQECLA